MHELRKYKLNGQLGYNLEAKGILGQFMQKDHAYIYYSHIY